MSWWGLCQRCHRRRDLGYIPGTNWLVCVECYIMWRNLPDNHPAKAGANDRTPHTPVAR